MKKKNILMIIINAVLVISTFIIVVLGIAKGAGEGQVGEAMYGTGYLKPFTVESNILCAICSFMVMIFNIDNLISKRDEIPYWIVLMQFIGTVAVTVTFLTVVFFLSPMQVMNGRSYFAFFANDMFFFHLFNPILSIIEFVLLIDKYKFSKKEILLGMLPTVLYSIAYMLMVVVFKGWSDFYGFTFGGKMYMIPVSLIMMYLPTYFIGFAEVKIHNRMVKNEK